MTVYSGFTMESIPRYSDWNMNRQNMMDNFNNYIIAKGATGLWW